MHVSLLFLADAAVREVKEETGIDAGQCLLNAQEFIIIETLCLFKFGYCWVIGNKLMYTRLIFSIFAEFQSIVAFRQQHRLTNYYDLSDLYFICRLKPVTFDINPCQDEIRKCQWMKLEELAVSKEATPLSHRAARLLMEGKERGYGTIDISMEEWPLNFPGYAATRTYKLFLRTPSESPSTSTWY